MMIMCLMLLFMNLGFGIIFRGVTDINILNPLMSRPDCLVKGDHSSLSLCSCILDCLLCFYLLYLRNEDALLGILWSIY